MSRVAFTAPHYLASESGIRILREGGSAIDAMVAAAATISVVYPHMNSLAGDGFWLIQRQGEKPVGHVFPWGHPALEGIPAQDS